MNTRFLETLVWLSRLGSFRETARQLHATQAAVSQRIAALESELGVLLVDRAARGLQFTPVGQRVLQQAERLLALEAELRLAARPGAPPTGRVRIGVIETVVHTWLAGLVHALAKRYPQLEPDLSVDTARNLREQFRAHRLDLLIQNDPVEEAAGNTALEVLPLCRFPLQWIGRPGLLPRRRLTPEDLFGVPLLTFSRTSSPHAHVRALFIGGEREPRISSFPSVAAILRLASEGYGLAAVPPLFVQAELQRGELVLYRGPALPPLDITLVHARVAAPAVQAVAATTREVVAQYCQGVGSRQPGGNWAQCLLAQVPDNTAADPAGSSAAPLRRRAGSPAPVAARSPARAPRSARPA